MIPNFMEYDFLHLEMAICINLRGFIFLHQNADHEK